MSRVLTLFDDEETAVPVPATTPWVVPPRRKRLRSTHVAPPRINPPPASTDPPAPAPEDTALTELAAHLLARPTGPETGETWKAWKQAFAGHMKAALPSGPLVLCGAKSVLGRVSPAVAANISAAIFGDLTLAWLVRVEREGREETVRARGEETHGV